MIRSVLLMVAVLALGVVGCGNDDDTDSESTDFQPDVEPPEGPVTSDTLVDDLTGAAEDGLPGGPAGGDGAATSPVGGATGVIGTIEVTITHPADADAVVYTVGCLGDTFTVTPDSLGIDGTTACARLGQPDVLARLADGPPADQICTEIYGGPDEAHITGELDGRPIDTIIDRANGCGISDWDDLLAGVLPPAVGVIN